jgi:hypothetical protein
MWMSSESAFRRFASSILHLMRQFSSPVDQWHALAVLHGVNVSSSFAVRILESVREEPSTWLFGGLSAHPRRQISGTIAEQSPLSTGKSTRFRVAEMGDRMADQGI